MSVPAGPGRLWQYPAVIAKCLSVAVVAMVTLFGGFGCDSLFAQQRTPYGAGGWTIGLLAGQFNDEGEFAPDNRATQMERGTLIGGFLGHVLTSRFFLQADFGYAPDLSWVTAEYFTDNDPTAYRDMSSVTAGLSAGYNLQPFDRLQVYANAGAGAVRWSVEDVGSETQFSTLVGAGARLFLSRSFAIQSGVRWRYTPDALVRLRADNGSGEDGMWVLEPSVGISFFVGGEGDADRDRVGDRTDACPDTPRGALIDGLGCPLDSDGDRVFDGLDACPNTPLGALVDERGCARDSDGDRVPDGIDECPNTPPGLQVDRRGCPLDGDGDGVPDTMDQCPNTAPGTEVDAEGCPLNPIQRGLEEVGRVVLQGVYFDFNRATLRPESRLSLDQAAQALLSNPTLFVEIQGHTDAIGSDSYNQTLSERRARAVYDYVLERLPGIDPLRLSWRGYGESQPLASNDSAEGRQENRRVEFVVREN